MDDSTLLGAITISKTGVRNSAGIVKYPGLGIIIRKNSGIAMCVLQEMPWLGTQSDIEIQYRLGKEKAEYSPCWETEEFSAVLIHPENFVTKLYGHKTLHVRITARSGEVYTVKFNISGAREALKDIAKAAGWK